MSVPQNSCHLRGESEEDNYLPSFIGNVIDDIYFNDAHYENQTKWKPISDDDGCTPTPLVDNNLSRRNWNYFHYDGIEMDWVVLQNIAPSQFMTVKSFFNSLGGPNRIRVFDDTTLLVLYNSVREVLTALRLDAQPIYFEGQLIQVNCKILTQKIFTELRAKHKDDKPNDTEACRFDSWIQILYENFESLYNAVLKNLEDIVEVLFRCAGIY